MTNNYSKIFSIEELTYWQTRYAPNLVWNFEDLILKKLARNERANAYGVRLEFPLTPDEGYSNSPFPFYASVQDKVIYAPISSIKFIDDLSIAYSWLVGNGFSTESLIDYIFCLKYGSTRFAGGKIPSPLKALHIPENALDNQLVDDNSQKVLNSIVVWILSHELAHIVYQHPSYETVSHAQSQQFETDADSFATEMFKRIGTAPLGMVLLFIVFTSFYLNKGDFVLEKDWNDYLRNSTHPVSNERLNSIVSEFINSPDEFIDAEPNKIRAKQIVESIGNEAKEIVDIIRSPKMQDFLKVHALALDVNLLYPRKKGDLVVMEPGYSEGLVDGPDFSGAYLGTYSHKIANGGEEKLNATFVFYRNKDKVTGRFSYGVGIVDVFGFFQNNQLTFNWKWGITSGKGLLLTNNKGEFSGDWGFDGELTGGGYLQGKKKAIGI